MNSPTPSQFCELQLRIGSVVQQQLASAVEEGNFNAVAAMARTLKEITSSYHDVMGNSSTPSKLFSQGLGYGSVNGFSSLQNSEPQKPKVATSYAYPDGFEGVTLLGKDAWGDE